MASNISIPVLLAITWLHTLADFALQTDRMATSKSKENKWLAIHVLTYSSVFLLAFGPLFAAITFALHFATDYVTSRITSRLWKAEKRHEFFLVIGIDQAMHFTALVLTYLCVGGW